jgi:aminotransferase
MAKEAKVAAAAGAYFGAGGEGYLRFSYATAMDQIKEGMDRLERFCQEQQK